MPMTPGDATAASGTMAKAIFDAMESVMGASETPAFATDRKKIAAAIAQGVCAHLAANADVRITTGMAGLQRTPNPNDPLVATLAPVADVVLSGALE